MPAYRPVQWARGDGSITNGYFHRWGERVIHDGAGEPIQLTVAIVELHDGNIVELEPSSIKFSIPYHAGR